MPNEKALELFKIWGPSKSDFCLYESGEGESIINIEIELQLLLGILLVKQIIDNFDNLPAFLW